MLFMSTCNHPFFGWEYNHSIVSKSLLSRSTAKGHGKTVLEQFYRSLTPEQLSSIKVVTGDGAKWITECVNEFTPECERCVDPFHVVEWAMSALDEVRRDAWREAYTAAKDIAKEHPRKPGRPKSNDPISTKVTESKNRATEIKTSTFALAKAPENLTENQRLKVEIIATTNPRLYRAYLMIKVSKVYS